MQPVVQVSIDDKIMDKVEQVFDESRSDAVASASADLFDSKNATVTLERSSKINDKLSIDAVLKNSDIAVSNGIKVGTDLLGTDTKSVTMEVFSVKDGGGGIAVHDLVDDGRVLENEKEIEMDKAEKVLDQSSSDALVTSVSPTNCNIAASNEVEVKANVLESNTVSQTREPSVGTAVCGSVNDGRASGDEKEIAMENTEKLLNESSSEAGDLSVPLSHSDISVSNLVKIGAESLDSKSGTLVMEPSSDHIEGGGINVQDQVDDERVSGDEKEVVMKDVEKFLDENEVNDEEMEGKYKVTDLVWGKVKNYPWWPGQIFDPSASTDKAKKFSNKKGFLIAYFGDQSFAWNKASNIKPFRKNFHKMEKQGKSKAFYHAVNCALDEVSRRIDFGLTCSCLSKEVYNNIKSQVFVNAGIKKEASEIEGGDNFSTVSTFKPANIVQSVQDLAREHFDGIGRLEVLSVRTQILAYLRWKGYNQFSMQFLGGLDDKLEDKSELLLTEEDKMIEDAKPASVSAKVSSKKRKLNARDGGADLVLNDKSEDASELALIEEDKVVADEKPIPVSAKVSSKKKKLNGGSGDPVPRKEEKCLKNFMLKGKSTGKSKSKKKSVDRGDSALDDNLEGEPKLPLMEDDKIVEDAKPTSEKAKVSSKRKKLNASNSDDSVPRRKEKFLKNVTQKENSSVKGKSKKSSDKKVTLWDSGFKKESRNTTDNRNLSNSPKKLFRIGDTICRIAKQLSESPSIRKEESMKSKNDDKSVNQTEPPSIHKKKSKKSKNDEKYVKQTESPSNFKKESKKSKNDEKSVEQMDTASILEKESKKSKTDEKSLEQSDPPSILKKESKKSKTDEKCVEQTQSPLILKKKSKNDEKCVEPTESPSVVKKESKKSKNDEKCVEPTESPSVVKKESKKSKNDEKCDDPTESPPIVKKVSQISKDDDTCVEQKESPSKHEKESDNSKNNEKCVEQSKENSKTSKESSATALILKFTNVDSIPSLTKLNEIFRRYGTVRETDTEILQKNNCAKVVFDEQSDAETAFSSAGKFSIFGPSLISYRLDYSPTLRRIYTRNKKRNRKDRKSDETNQSEAEAA